MERVAFLIEETNVTIRCLLNPESVVVRRTAGVAERRSRTGRVSGTNLPDYPLIYTGGGRTELELDLLFDTSLVDAGARPGDVRQLTEPIWNLTENRGGVDRYGAPSLVRFLWGKAWNVPGIVTSIAERLEQFNPSGAPQRSWLSMRLVRVADPVTDRTSEPMETEGWSGEAPPMIDTAPPAESPGVEDFAPGPAEASEDGPDFPFPGGLPDIDLFDDEEPATEDETEPADDERTEPDGGDAEREDEDES